MQRKALSRGWFAGLLWGMLLVLGGQMARAETLMGTALIRERIALPPGVVFEAVIADSARAGAPAIPLARIEVADPGQAPITFAIPFDPADLRPEAIYTLRASLRHEGRLIFVTDQVTRVLQDGQPRPVEVMLRAVRPAQTGDAGRPIGAHGLRLPASFTGVRPCDTCAGVRHHLDLWPDQVYHMRRDWIGHPDGPLRRDEVGRWSADPLRGALILEGAGEMPLVWQVTGPDRLRQMDLSGMVPLADGAHDLISGGKLTPTPLGPLFLQGEVQTSADGVGFRDCLTGRVYPVHSEADFPALAAALGRHVGPLLVSFEGSIMPDVLLDAPGFATVTVVRFVGAFPDQTCAHPNPQVRLRDVYWRIAAMEGEAVPPIAGRREAHLVLRDDPGHGFHATVGCNQVLGRYALEGENLTFQAGASTLMACPPPLDVFEQRLQRVLAATRGFRLEGRSLVLTGADQAVLADLEAGYLR
jgi:copper homeostasis protein (lipoprotein)